MLWMYTKDCDVAVARLRGGGVPVVQEPAEQPWGERMAIVTDPDGNRVIIAARVLFLPTRQRTCVVCRTACGVSSAQPSSIAAAGVVGGTEDDDGCDGALTCLRA